MRMKNLTLTAVVVLAMLLAGTAMAQKMDYKLYGQAHLSTDMQSDGDETGILVSSNQTRFGIRGSYETDVEAFTVVFQYENHADFNGEAMGLSTRNSFVGLQGDWGRLIWGRHDSPVYLLGRSVDFFDSRIGELRNVTQNFGQVGWDLRVPSMLMYSTPLLGDAFTVHAQYRPDEGMDDYDFLSTSAVYHQGGLMIGLGFEMHGKAWEAYEYYDEDEEMDVWVMPEESSSALRAVASYEAGDLTVAGLFQMINNVGGVKDVKAQTFGLGLSYKLEGGIEPKAQFYMMDPNTDMDDDGASMLVVGLDYHLNQQARLYLAYAMMMNEDGADYVPFFGGHGKQFSGMAAAPGDSPYGVSVGIIANW